MTKKNPLRQRPSEPLAERQRRLWNIAENIQLAQEQSKPLPDEISEWVYRAFKRIACGADANEALNVQSRQGQRKDGLKSELCQKIENGYIAAATEAGDGKKKTTTAIDEVSAVSPTADRSTIRKNWNKSTANRKPIFTLGKK